MDDRELLESAARANWAQELADDEVSIRYSEPNEGILYLHADNQDHNGHDHEFVWNPLIDDGDALRLAVKLNLRITIEDERCGCVTASWGDDYDNHAVTHSETPETAASATRRAIVQAAAKIGKMTSAPLVRAD
jgi:hypothetical protein